MKYKYQLISINTFLLLFCIINVANSAILYLSPDEGSYHAGDTFLLDIRLDTEGEYINTVEANLIFSSEVLEVRDLGQGNSILSLWVKEPKSSNGVISFIGGTPGGYQGVDGLLARIALKANERGGFAQLIFQDNSKALLNDGKGTKANLIAKGANFTISAKRLEIPEDEWQEEIKKDKTPPQPFEIEIIQDPLIFEGRYFITFSTTDKETGIDHYEVKEGKRNWKIASSPYLLENQGLTNDIWIKAIDKAGNEWIEIIKAPKKPVWKCVLDGILVLITILVIIGLGWLILKRNTKHHKYEH